MGSLRRFLLRLDVLWKRIAISLRGKNQAFIHGYAANCGYEDKQVGNCDINLTNVCNTIC